MAGLAYAERGTTEVEIIGCTCVGHEPPPCEWCGAPSQYEEWGRPPRVSVCSKECAARYFGVLPSHVHRVVAPGVVGRVD